MRKRVKQATVRRQADQDELHSTRLHHQEETATESATHAPESSPTYEPVPASVARLQSIENSTARQTAFRNLQNQYGNAYAGQVARQIAEKSVQRAPESKTANFGWPVSGTSNAVTSFFYRKSGAFHGGWDFAGYASEPMQTIVAMDDGKVVAAGPASGFGNHYVKIDHGNGFTTEYGHNSAHHVKAGDKISKGQAIATEGAEGHCIGGTVAAKGVNAARIAELDGKYAKLKGAHLHVYIRKNGEKQDPADFLPGAPPKDNKTAKVFDVRDGEIPQEAVQQPGGGKAQTGAVHLSQAQETSVINALRKGLTTGLGGYDLTNEGFYALHPNMRGKQIGANQADYKAEYLYIHTSLVPKAKTAPQKQATSNQQSTLSLDQIAKYLKKEYPTLYSFFSDYLSWKTISSIAEKLGQSLSQFYESAKKSLATTTATKTAGGTATTGGSTSSPKTSTPKSAGDAPAWRSGPLTDEMVDSIVAARQAIPEVTAANGLKSVSYGDKKDAGFMYTPGQSAEEKAFSKSKSGKQSDGTVATARDIVWEELASEGASNSINTYDGQGMTWGRGFAAGGMLPDVLWRFFQEVPGSRAEFNSIGIDTDGKVIYTVDVTAKKVVKGNSELHSLRKDRKISSFFILMGNKHPKALVEAQYATVTESRAGAANVPAWATKLSKPYLQFIGHASHWYSGAFAWSHWEGHTSDWSAMLTRYIKLLPGRHMYRTKSVGAGIVNEQQAIDYARGIHSKSWQALTEATLEAAVSVDDPETLESGDYFKVGKNSYRKVK